MTGQQQASDAARVEQTARRLLGRSAALRMRGHSVEIGVYSWRGRVGAASGEALPQFVPVVQAWSWADAEHLLLSLSATALLAIINGQRPVERPPITGGCGDVRPLVYVTVSGGLAAVCAPSDGVDVAFVDYDVLDSDYLDPDELRQWITDARQTARLLRDGRTLTPDERRVARDALASGLRTARGSLRQLLAPGRGGDRRA